MPVAPDHFYKSFNRYPEGQPRFEAVARHAAMLLNAYHEEQDKRRHLLEMSIQKMSEQVPGIALALELKDQLDEMND